MAKKSDATILETAYNYQTRLQGVANDLAIKLATIIADTDPALLKTILKELPKKDADIKKELTRLQKIIAKIETIRKKSYDASKDLVLSTSADVIETASEEVAKEVRQSVAEQSRAERENRFVKTLDQKQQDAILQGQGIDGKTVEEWFGRWQRDDLERITSAVKRASVESLTPAEITRYIRGTKANNYADGVLATTKVGAVTLARTLINGVSNNTRVETIKENLDVIDGVKFLGTLDGRTCPYCASYDGYIWRGEVINKARRPPLHPNCRCCLIPQIDLRDDDGNVIEVEAERPAANADFDALAKEAYNTNARKNGWKRRWDDLSAETRKKYYYQAQKDYEKRTGKPAYRQVDQGLSFADYFAKQDDAFKRSWLGAKRFEMYQAGTLTEKQIFAPDLSYKQTIFDLKQTTQDGDESVLGIVANMANEQTTEPTTQQTQVEKTVQTGLRTFDDLMNDPVVVETLRKADKEYEDFLADEDKRKSDFVAMVDSKYEEFVLHYAKIFGSKEYRLAKKKLDKWEEKERKKLEDANDKALLDRAKKYHDVLMPKDDKKSKNRVAFKDKCPKYRDKSNREAVSFGLDVVARLCDNVGIPVNYADFEIQEKWVVRGFYSNDSKRIFLNNWSYNNITSNTTAHEVGHWIEKEAAGGEIEKRVFDFYERATKRDAYGNIEYVMEDGHKKNDIGNFFREFNVDVPDPYIQKEYLYSPYDNSKIRNTECMSMFTGTLATEPWKLLDPKYKEYYDGMANALNEAGQAYAIRLKSMGL